MIQKAAQDVPRANSDDEIRKLLVERVDTYRHSNRFLEPAPNWDSPTLAGAGAVRSTGNDMPRFLAAALDEERAPARRVD